MSEEEVSLHSGQTLASKDESARDDWRPYHKDLIGKLLLEKVRDATASQSIVKLEESLQTCEQHDLGEHTDVVKGRERLEVMLARHDLKEVLKTARKFAIKIEILKIKKDKTLKKELQQDVIEAEQFIHELERRNRASEKILALNRKTMSEVRRCFNPPRCMQRVIQAALLLMGEHEQTTKEWHNCLRLLNPQGKAGMSKRIMDFNSNSVHPEISARAKEMLTQPFDLKTGKILTKEDIDKMTKEEKQKHVQTMDLSTVRQASPAAATFYVWSMGVIDECESRYEGEEPPEAASIKRQQYLLKKPDLTPRNSDVSPTMKRKYYASTNNDSYLQKQREPEY